MRRSTALLVFVLLVLFTTAAPLESLSANSPQETRKGIRGQFEKLLEAATTEGYVRIIIKLWVPNIEELTAASNMFRTPPPGKGFAWEGLQADVLLRDQIDFIARIILEDLGGTYFRVNHIFTSIPYLALEVSAEALLLLGQIPEVLYIEEDYPISLIDPGNKRSTTTDNPRDPSSIEPPALNNTVSIIGADTAWGMGYTGSGWYVAILDTGIHRSHEFFQGKSIVEACFARGESGTGDCPNGSSTMTGTGSAVHHADTYQGWDHGTHVAGIATGNNGSLYGVAKDANIIAIQVFSRFADCESDPGDQPCVMTWNSDSLAGLDYLYSIRGSYSIASANMSIGGGSYSSACDGDARKAAIDNLRAAGIATVIATGNDGSCGSISRPACISTSVAIGSSTDADGRSSFSNWHTTMQRLFAPGSSIYSATADSDTSYESWSGTSMATPHAAGGWALLKHASPTASVAEILTALQDTGVGITTSCDGYTTPIPRIQIDAAISELLNPPVIPTVTTSAMSSITQTSAVGGGTVSSDGGAAVTARGVCWSTSPDPTTADSKTSDGSGTGSFVSSLSGLSPNTTYYVRAYAANAAGTAYGNSQSFNTLANVTLPSVSTASVSSITQTSAVGGGTVSSDGGAAVTARGVCWSTSPDPTTADSKTSDGSGTGSFTSNLSGLSPDTTYHVRAYATNSSGTTYGISRTFHTLRYSFVIDFDGDGDTDIAVWRPSNGKWYIREGITVGFGVNGDIPVPGDYDGDGITDIAVWRPSNGKWYVRGGIVAGFGVSTDIPVPGDYDGDGTTDIAVWRPSNGKWYVRGGIVAGFGKPGDYPLNWLGWAMRRSGLY